MGTPQSIIQHLYAQARFRNRPAIKHDSNAIPQEKPSVISSEGAIGKQFNPKGAIGQIGEKIGGPLSSKGVIGSQFDASQNGIAGHVERAVDGPRNPAGSDNT